MNQNEIDAKIGEAWKAHHAGNQETAIEQFLRLIEDVPDHIDAYWGLGLSYRDAGNQESALEAFHKVKELVLVELESEGGQRGRYFMLNRMVDQQIEQMNDFLVG
ncbi:MAG: tetratricopeptide repeat protein [Chloroflexi bacterium]|nr:tetratricopeptide repeat protein [Chloroflexota bacterium]